MVWRSRAKIPRLRSKDTTLPDPFAPQKGAVAPFVKLLFTTDLWLVSWATERLFHLGTLLM